MATGENMTVFKKGDIEVIICDMPGCGNLMERETQFLGLDICPLCMDKMEAFIRARRLASPSQNPEKMILSIKGAVEHKGKLLYTVRTQNGQEFFILATPGVEFTLVDKDIIEAKLMGAIA